MNFGILLRVPSIKIKLPKIEKFNYLKSRLSGDAQKAISGLPLSNDNYDIAIDILKTRFGRDQELVDLHYTQLINLQPATNKINNLRSLLNNIEKHLRCLSVLKQNIEQDVFVAMIRAKLPDEVLFQLEMVNGSKNKWTVEKLREGLDDYITARERSEQQIAVDTVKHNYWRSYQNPETPNKWNSNTQTKDISRNFLGHVGSAEALVATAQQTPQQQRYYNQCRYCERRHWSDECPHFRSIVERKQKLKDSCYRCLKVGHVAIECALNKTCVYCGEANAHHRSLCPIKFKPTITNSYLSGEISNECDQVQENVLISSSEIVLMQTATTKVKNPNNSMAQITRLFLVSGSQRTYITQKLADRLNLKGESEQEIKLVTFGCDKPKLLKTKQTTLCIKLKNGNFLDNVPILSR